MGQQLVCAGPIPNPGESALPDSQAHSGQTGVVSRDRCHPSRVSPDGYDPRVIGNTYQK
jgi:hypothetical protein